MRHIPLEDPEETRELWRQFQEIASNADKFPGEDHSYWRVQSEGKDVGLCSAVHRHDKGYAYLSYAIFDPRYRGTGLQRRSIQFRLKWAKRQGALYATTYTALHNYPSIANLLKCGFRFAEKPRGWVGVGSDVHYFEKQL